MDRTLMKRVAKKKKVKKNKRPTPPPQPQQTLEDVLDHEVTANSTRVVVNKGEAAPPVVIEPELEEEATVAPDTESTTPAVPETEEEEEEEDTVTAQEVLDTVAAATQEEEKPKKKSSNRGGRSGDFGAAYHELYTQLCMRMLNRIYRYFQKLYSAAGGNKKKFRKKLEGIQQWNQVEINRRAKEILKIYKDTESYFRYAYAANVMLMSVVVQKDEDSQDVEIEVPKFSEFILKAYIESARVLYDNAGVLDPSLADRDKLRIREELFSCFSKAIATALRMMVPLEAIAPNGSGDKEPLESFGDSESEAESIDEEEASSSEESESEEESGSEESESESESESEEEEESESGSEEEEPESGSEEEMPPIPGSKKRVKASRKALQTPDNLSIDQGLSYY